MRPGTKVALALAGIFVVGPSIGVAIGHGHADAHSSGALFQNAHCLDSGAWGATLNITATNPELNPVAHITTAASPYDVAVPAAGYSTLVTAPADTKSITVSVKLTWSDGFAQNLGSSTATRPSGCTPPATTTPPTTTCAGAIPPRVDCGTPTTPPASFATPTTIVPIVESTPQITAVPPTGSAVPSVPRASSPTPSGPASISRSLPATGAGTNGLIGFGLALVLIGGTLIVVKRRGS